MKDRDSAGLFLPGHKLSVGNRGGKVKAANKPYSDAVREILDAPQGQTPAAWGDRKSWTNAQEMAERDIARALAGDTEACKRVVERAEGKVPQAPEDRESAEKQNANLLAGLSLLGQLKAALGMGDVLDSEVVEQPALPTGEDRREEKKK